MKAIRWYGKEDVRYEDTAEPQLRDTHDCVIQMTAATICGSDLHIYNGLVPSMEKGDIIGHEFMGKVVAVGRDVQKLSVGQRVVVLPTIGCGRCAYCAQGLFSLCDVSNPNAEEQATMLGYPTSAIYGYSHLFGGIAGGLSEYVRVPFADFGALPVPKDMPDERLLFLVDALPTGYMAAEHCCIKKGDTVAVWGCGAVGLFAMTCALMLGASRIIAIDRFAFRLAAAREHAKAETINYMENNVVDRIKKLTGNHGPDACLDAVGMEAHAKGAEDVYDKVKQAVRLQGDHPHVLREAIVACKKAGTVSIIGAYLGAVDRIPLGVAFCKALTFKMGIMQAQKYSPMLLDKIINKEIDPSFVVTHEMRLSDAGSAFKLFRDDKEHCLRIVLRP